MFGRRGRGEDLFDDEFDRRRQRRRLFVIPIFGLGVGMMVLSAGWVLMTTYLGLWEESTGLSAEFDSVVVEGDGFANEILRKLTRSVAWYTGVFWLGALVAVFALLRWFWLLLRLMFSRR